ncbi:uncharacterized protein [Venturia canescens]|uniref:uncharacterized protein n=1 Tax=Venturia canescens TaxID=32260 RepID=UPI001C9D274B|nr:uncharacterized protein LOC122418388 [Venturia canescens]
MKSSAGLTILLLFFHAHLNQANESSGELHFGNETEFSNSRVLSRRKRYLIFPEGSNVQCVYCLTIGAYAKPGELVVGLTAALAWELPSKFEKKLSNLLHRRSRSVIYPKIEAFLQSAGLDGRSCVMRALCEAGQRDSTAIASGTFVQELLHAIFSLRNDGTKFEVAGHEEYDRAHQQHQDCSRLYPTCQHSIYDLDF